jgi:UDP-N-acetylglucosamine 2-epimerase (non-hydrolysing)
MAQSDSLLPIVLLTGQHDKQLTQGLQLFNVKAEHNLRVMTDRQELPDLAGRIMSGTALKLKQLKPDYLLVQGDTLTTFAVGWAAFLEGIPIGHVEAGLRTHNMQEPFPEESNRRLTSVLTDLDLAPTWDARENLIAEGKASDQIVVTGQTGVDAALFAAKAGKMPSLPPGPYVTVTMHRRENWPRLTELAGVIAKLAKQHEYCFVYPVHLNPIVREQVWPVLEHLDRVVLMDPLEYGAMTALINHSDLVITDSGGIQEEAVTLGIPAVVMRNLTERGEGIDTGLLTLAGTDPALIYQHAERLLSDDSARPKGSTTNPYGDGRAAGRVTEAVAWRLNLAQRPTDWQPNGSENE